MIRSIRPHIIAIDISIAVLCVAFRMLIGFDNIGGIVMVLLMGAGLALYRLSPALALGIVWVGAIVQMVSGMSPDLANAAILAVLYSTARYGPANLRWLGLVSAGAGAVVASVYMTFVGTSFSFTTPADTAGVAFSAVFWFFSTAATLGLSWTIGLLVKTWMDARESQRARWEAQQTVVVEQERTRIARDMHDVVAHSLAVVIAQADGARYARATDPEAVDASLTTIASTARAALADVRLLLTQLRHEQGAGPQPMLADLDQLVAQMRAAGLAVDERHDGIQPPMAASGQIAIYRIVQEALTNALRHGDATAPVTVRLVWAPDVATVAISNGVRLGHTSTAAVPTLGHGLAGMRERAQLVGGSLDITETDGRFIVTARIPVTA